MAVTEMRSEGVALPVVAPVKSRADTEIACRALDIALSIALLILLLPLFVLIAIAIRLDSPGPVLFRQRRCGLGLEEFTMNKFRTMHRGCSADPHREFVLELIRNGEEPLPENRSLYKLEADSRVTRVGRVLRRLSLDELPQLWNVVVGDMSVVGPRPAIRYEVESYSPQWFQRFSVRPGITGLWQVSGRSRLGMDRAMELDLEYVRRRSLWLNLGIVVKTPWVVAHTRGAA
jgi:lipopolysaccharide/colanic/teichoic acid biosynthesis glycosyltransferase